MATERGLGFGLTEAEAAEVQRRVRGARRMRRRPLRVGCCAKTVQRLLRRTGGLRHGRRSRAPLRLSMAEREEISRGLLGGSADHLRMLLVGAALRRPSPRAAGPWPV